MSEESQPAGDLLFAWLTPIESHVDRRLHHGGRPRSPGPLNSPLLRATTAIRRTFSAGNKAQLHRQRVKEAHEACLWLRAAGFPQYVQMFEDGQFPINLSKFQVEQDHEFLDQAAIDALIRRLNTLNRCAGIMEEIRAKCEDSEDEGMRALSEHWHFKRKARKWSRKTKHRLPIGGSEQMIPRAVSPESSQNLLVSELRNSLTHLDRRIKTYSFLPGEDFPPIIVHSPSGSIDDSFSRTADLSTEVSFSTHSKEFSFDSFEETTFEGSMDNFANCIFDTLDSNLKNLHVGEMKSHSLPDVFTASQFFNGVSPSDDSPFSSTSVSTASILDISKGSAELLNDTSSPIHMNGDSEIEEPHFLEVPETNIVGTFGSSGTFDSGSECYESEKERERPDSPQHKTEKLSFAESSGEATYPEVVSPGITIPRRKSSDTRPTKSSKWHSFQRAHSFRQAFKPVRTLIPIEELSVGQISVLRKLSLVKLTALLELHKAKANVARILKGRKPKFPEYKSKRVFGVPLSENVRRTGRVLPQTILSAIQHLRETGLDTTGIFRRAASKAKVEALKLRNETNPDMNNYESYSSYDIADMVKLYFRELPEPLLTNKFSEILIVIHETIPKEVRLQALQSVMLLMSDENREALHTLLSFLKEVTTHADTNQMDAQNLAVCFAPTLFCLAMSPKPSPLARRGSFRRTTVNHSPNLATNKEVTDSVASCQCLAELISSCDKLFMVAADMMQVCKFSHLEFGDPVPYHELGQYRDRFSNFRSYMESCVSTVLKESRRRFKGWAHSESMKGVEVSYLKANDGVPLRLWRGVAEIPASADAVLRRLWSQRHVWDGSVQHARQVAQVDQQTEVFQYVTPSTPPLTNRDHCILRSWQYDATSESYVVVATSVSHPSADLLAGIRATELATRYLIEPLDKVTCRLTFICRVDMRGRSADYYNHAFGPYLASRGVNLIRDSFQELEFLETPV